MRFQNVRLVHQVVVALFRLDRLIFVLQRFVEIDLVGQEIAGRIVPTFPVILVEPVQLPVNAGGHQVVHLDLDFERHRNLVPAHGDDGGIRLHVVEIVGQRIMGLGRSAASH